MSGEIFSSNLASLRKVNPALADMLAGVVSDDTYSGSILTRSGHPVPCYGDGTPANSRYDPETEADRTIADLGDASFVLFLGIAGAFQIRAFLQKNPGAYCAAAEKSLPALRSLLESVALDDILSSSRVYLLKDCLPDTLMAQLPARYLPAVHGSFATCSFRSWTSRFFSSSVQDAISSVLAAVGRDYSVQAHFGRIWFSNFLKNMHEMRGRFVTELPGISRDRSAIIAAAGPSLEKDLQEIVANRDRYCVFSTDTACGTLAGYGIVPDYYVTIDPQHYSSWHLFRPPEPETVFLADCVSNPAAVQRALSYGARVILFAGGHPLSRMAANCSPLPVLDTASGTVTGAARNAAIALGYDNPRVIGADFAYTHGKPYARNTYLSELFDSSSQRTASAESAFTALMFRSAVERTHDAGGWTYHTEVMRSYKQAMNTAIQPIRWTDDTFSAFPVDEFLGRLTRGLKEILSNDTGHTDWYTAMLPFFAWFQRHHAIHPGENGRKKAIQLALDMIAGYTVAS